MFQKEQEMKQIFSIGIMICIIFLALFLKKPLINFIDSAGVLAGIICIIFVAFLVFFPVVPYAIFAGMLGSIFGIVYGILISLIGIMSGTLLLFILSRYGFQDLGQEKIRNLTYIREFEEKFQNNAFMCIFISRLIPVIPSPIVTFLSALSKIPWHLFIFASLMGKLPSIIFYTVAGGVFDKNKILAFGIYGSYFLLIFCLVYVRKSRQKLST